MTILLLLLNVSLHIKTWNILEFMKLLFIEERYYKLHWLTLADANKKWPKRYYSTFLEQKLVKLPHSSIYE